MRQVFIYVTLAMLRLVPSYQAGSRAVDAAAVAAVATVAIAAVAAVSRYSLMRDFHFDFFSRCKKRKGQKAASQEVIFASLTGMDRIFFFLIVHALLEMNKIIGSSNLKLNFSRSLEQ